MNHTSLKDIGGDKNQVRNVRVMSDEWGDLSICTGHRDASINPPGEICEAILEVMMSDLYNI